MPLLFCFAFAALALAAPQTVYVNPDGSIVNTTNFEFKLGKLQVCDALGNNCVAVDASLDAKQPLDADLTAIAALTTDPFGLQVLTKATAASLRTYIGAGTSNFDGSFTSLTSKPTSIGGYGITDFNSLGDARWSLLAHTHTFASLTSKPTTIAGYGITDFNSLGDARWQPLDADLATWSGITPGTGVGTALAINVGTAGAFITNGGALGTPSSGTLTNATGLPIAGITGLGTNIAAFLGATKPTTIAGYGITDFNSLGDARWQPLDSDLTSWASVTRASGFDTFTATPTLVNLKTLVTDETTVGWNILTLANPGAITFLKVAADNSVTAESATTHRTSLGLAIGSNVEAWDADLDTYAANTPTTLGLNLVKLANPSAITFLKVAADNTVSTRTAAQFIGDLDADLTTWAGITPGTGVGTFLATPSSANLSAALTDETGSGVSVFGTSPTLVTPKIAKVVAPSDSVTAIQLANAAGTAFVDFDSTNKRVGIGTNAPSTFLHILDTNTNGALTEMQRMEVTDSGAGRTDYFKFLAGATSSRGGKIIFGETGSTFGESGIAFTLAQTTIYQDATWPIVFQTNGVDRLTIGGSGGLTSNIADSGTNTITNGLTIGHQSSGTPAAGFGEAILGNLNSSTTADQNAFRLTYSWTTATHASRTSKATIQLVNNAAALADVLTLNGTGTANLAAAGTSAGSIVTIDGTQTLTNKSIDAGQLTGTIVAGRMPALTGDATTSAGSVATTVTKINGVDQTAAWSAYTPTITSSVGTITTVGSVVGRYRQIGKTVFYTINLIITTNGGTASGEIRATLPLTAGTATRYVGSGMEAANTGKMLWSLVDPGTPTLARIKFYDSTYPGANGADISVTGVYELP